MFSLTYLVLMATKLIGWIDCNVSRAGFLCMQLLRASCLKGPCTQLNALLLLFWENRKAKKEGKEGKGPVPKITYTLIHYIYWYSKQAYEWQHQSLPFYKSVSGASKILRKLLSSHTWYVKDWDLNSGLANARVFAFSIILDWLQRTTNTSQRRWYFNRALKGESSLQPELGIGGKDVWWGKEPSWPYAEVESLARKETRVSRPDSKRILRHKDGKVDRGDMVEDFE